jgi:ubiquinol-cytochrome c reductase iron-sulfur subunit
VASWRLRDLIAAGATLTLARRKPRLRDDQRERIVPDGPRSPRSELLVHVLLLAGAVCAVAFVVVYALDRLPRQTQLLGASLGLALLLVAAALIVMSKRLVVTEELEEDYPEPDHRDEQETIAALVEDAGSRITRRRLLTLSFVATGGALGVALVTPIASLGPVLTTARFYATPWRRGRRLVDETGKPYRADDVEEDTFYTAFPEGADKEDVASALVLVRLPPAALDLPAENTHYAAKGIVAYSKICTHAGCAIALYRTPLFQPDEPRPALVCPCHYSTFDPGAGGKVVFGPAGRKLPMLPLTIDPRGELRAAGTFDEPIGPSWWGVRMRKAT